MSTIKNSMIYIIAAFIMLLTLTGCIGSERVVESDQNLPAPTSAVSIPNTGLSPASTQTPLATVEPLLVAPTVQNTSLPASNVTPQADEAIVAADNLNLRIGPGINYAVIRLLQQGQGLATTGRSNDGLWIEVHTSDGSAGWVYSDYLESKNNLADLPVTEAHGGLDSPAPVQNATFSILMSIEDNVATVTISKFPPNRKIAATLGPAGRAPGLVVANGQTDATGKTTLSFMMPAYWEDGTKVTQTDLVLAVSTNDSSFSRHISVVYIH